MADQVHIRLLGGFGVAAGDRSFAAGPWRLRKARSLLKLLYLTPGHRTHRSGSTISCGRTSTGRPPRTTCTRCCTPHAAP